MTNRISNPLCTFDELYPYIEEIFPVQDEAALLRMSRQGNAPEYFRTGTQRSSPALFRKADWFAFAKERWGLIRPDLIQNMADAGFNLVDVTRGESSVEPRSKALLRSTKRAAKS